MNEMGWRKAFRIALGYDGVTKESPIVKLYAKRYGVTPEMLEILEQEAAEEKKRPKSCWKCGGSGVASRRSEYLVLCDCEASKRYKTLGATTNTL